MPTSNVLTLFEHQDADAFSEHEIRLLDQLNRTSDCEVLKHIWK